MQATLLKRRMASLVLAWFVAFIAVAGLAPWVQAQPMPMDSICTIDGVMPSGSHDGSPTKQKHADHTLKCFMCAGTSAPPPPAVAVLLPSTDALAHALRPLVAAHLASLARAPLPARGPPLFS